MTEFNQVSFIIMNVVLQNIGFIRYFSYLALIVYNLVVSGVILLLNRGLFERLEMN
jgi:hypothetical protein